MNMCADPNVPDRIYVANFSTFMQSQRGLWRYEPANGWNRLFDDNWVKDITVHPADPNRLALATHKSPFGDTITATGIWFSNDGGISWDNFNDGLPMIRVLAVEYSPNGKEIHASLAGRGYYRRAAFIPADVNRDGNVNLLDVGPFINFLSSGDYLLEADMNCDGVVNLLDVGGFVGALGG